MANEVVVVEPSISIEGTSFRVLRYRLREALSELSALHCELSVDGEEVSAPEHWIGKRAELVLARSDGSQRRSFAGQVVACKRASARDGVRSLHLEVAPRPWALTKRTDCRVFQDMLAQDIVSQVLDGAGLAADGCDWQLTEPHPVRPYTVQYRETDWTFVSRILCEEGIYFAVEQTDDGDVLVFSDNAAGYGEVEAPSTLPFQKLSGFNEPLDHVFGISQRRSITTEKVALRDYNPETPAADLTVKADCGGEGAHALEHYDFPGRYGVAAEGKRLAAVQLDALLAQGDVVTGDTGVLTLSPGLRFSVDGHPYEPLNREYLITWTEIEGTTPRLGAGPGVQQPHRYRCRFGAVPTSQRYQPPRAHQAAGVVGLQTAITTGAAGSEIHADEAGRVKIRYHWDRCGAADETSSLWVRTSQAALGGAMLLPRMGWEVVVDHLEADPDAPMVMGRLYNGTSPPPYALPEGAGRSALQTATTPGGGSVNEMRMSDGAGAEEMYFNASKDMSVDVKNNSTESIGNDRSRAIGADQSVDVTNSLTASVGGSQSIEVGGDQKVHVETLQSEQLGGDHSLNIGGNRDMKIGGDHRREVAGSSKASVGGMEVDLVVGSVTHDTLGSYRHDVGAVRMDITAGDKSLLVGGSATETVAAAKIVAVIGGRGVDVGGSLTEQVGGAIINVATGDRAETAGASYTEIAAGAQVVKANNITIEAETMLSIVMGASTITLLPAVVAIAGVSVKLDGEGSSAAVLVVDN